MFKLAFLATLYTLLLLSCAPDIAPPPLPDELSSSSSDLAELVPSSSSSLVVSSSSIALSSSSSYVGGSSSSSLGGGDSVNSGSSSSSAGSVSSSSVGGTAYETVVIDTQIWMKKNLDYNVAGVCYDNDPANCNKYGRLYDWATAMALPSKCNSKLSTSDAECAIATPNHRGICPSGWHIPSNADWDALYRSADGTSGTNSPYYSPTAGKHLKAKEGWTDCGPSGSGKSYSCEDTYNFSALPGGGGDSNGSFYYAGSNGFWWSASEYDSDYAYGRSMYFNGENAYYNYYGKSLLFSVRCLQD